MGKEKRRVFRSVGPLALDCRAKDEVRVSLYEIQGRERLCRSGSLRRVGLCLSGGIADSVVKDSMKQNKKKDDRMSDGVADYRRSKSYKNRLMQFFYLRRIFQ
jgi:hypothetical protein